MSSQRWLFPSDTFTLFLNVMVPGPLKRFSITNVGVSFQEVRRCFKQAAAQQELSDKSGHDGHDGLV